jgi:hypothetical protein
LFIPELLNKNGLFKYLSGLPRQKDQRDDIADYLFRATSSIIQLARLEQIHQLCLSEYELFKSDLDVKRNRIVFGSESLFSLINEVPPTLTTLRIMQNMLLPICARVLDLKSSVPSSLNDTVKNINRIEFPSIVKEITQEYWHSDGKNLKDYRDLDQHNHVIIKHTFLEVKPKPKILVLLPDHPENKSAKSFTFENEINAIEYLPEAFKKIHDWTEDIVMNLGIEIIPKPYQLQTELSQLGELIPVQGGVLSLIMFREIVGGKKRFMAIEVSQLDDGRLSIRQIFKDA